MRLEIHVRPGASREAVGGTFDGALIVAVREVAEGGRATRAALRALAGRLGVAPSAVRLVRGANTRRKLVDVLGNDPERLDVRLRELREGT